MIIKQIVIDASVALKWRLHDEEATEEADALWCDFVEERLGLLIPTLFDYEVTNALKVAVVKKRISEEDALTTAVGYQQLSLKRYHFAETQQPAFQIACRYQRTVYDSAYIALAQSQRLWLYTGDRRLFNGVGEVLPFVKWIGDYQFESIPEEGRSNPL